MQLRQPRLKSGAWERLRGIYMEKTGSNMEEEGSREQLWTKWKAIKEQAKEKEQESPRGLKPKV